MNLFAKNFRKLQETGWYRRWKNLLNIGHQRFVFKRKTATLTSSGQAAPYPWAYSYTYPSDCIAVRTVNSAATQPDINDPVPTQWVVGDDPVAGKVIWTNISGASAVYTAQVTSPAQWEPLFINALVASLASVIAAKWNKEGVKFYSQVEDAETETADEVKG